MNQSVIKIFTFDDDIQAQASRYSLSRSLCSHALFDSDISMEDKSQSFKERLGNWLPRILRRIPITNTLI